MPAFIHLPAFAAVADKALGPEGIRALENAILADPAIGTSLGCGLYKARFACPGAGKSGGFRCIYFVGPRTGTVYLLILFPKNERANITEKERSLLCERVRRLE